MNKERPEPLTPRGSEGENEWTGEHERRKRNWSEQDRKWRKERRHPTEDELDEPLAPPLSRRFQP
jgi:hypothetical protein